MIIHAVTFEERDQIGRIVETVAFAFATDELAEQYAKRHNETESTAPRTALVRQFQVLSRLPRLLEPAEKPNSGTPLKLRPEDIPVIKARYARKERVVDIAASYGISTRMIYRVVSGEAWGWV